jgi:TfoX/Sxy family transcriptional regulator of competence genes
MTEAADWHALRARYQRFQATELGQLYVAYDRATIAYWRLDASETVSNKRLRELDEAARKASNAFVAKLMELANV